MGAEHLVLFYYCEVRWLSHRACLCIIISSNNFPGKEISPDSKVFSRALIYDEKKELLENF